jgi:hypothetical protein
MSIRTQPNKKVFEDIRTAAIKTWELIGYPYTRTQKYSRVEQLYKVQNIGDNWLQIVKEFRREGQMTFWHFIEYNETADFLSNNKGDENYFVPRFRV